MLQQISIAAFMALAIAVQWAPAIASETVESSDNPSEAAVNYTPVIMKATSTPQVFQGSDHKYHLAYELVLTNYDKRGVSIEEVAFLGDDGKVLKSLKGKDLSAVFTAGTGTAGTRLPPGTTGIVWANLTFDQVLDAPARLTHKLTSSGFDFTGKAKSWTYDGATIEVNKSPVIAISPPLRGGKWVAFGGYEGTVGHRRALFPIDNNLHSAQRYAIDWLRLDDANQSTHTDPLKNENSAAYGQTVYAVADGTIIGVVDRFGEQTPYDVKGDDRFHFPAGNSITLGLSGGLYGMYAHLKPGSIKVKPGQQVKRGDVLAQVGNSGNSTAPHLHFHVTDDPHILGNNGVPYAFSSFVVLGEITDIPKFFDNDRKAKPHTFRPSESHERQRNELPKEGHILEFPDN